MLQTEFLPAVGLIERQRFFSTVRVLDGVGFVIFDMAANINWGDAVFISLHFLKALTKHCIVRMNSMFWEHPYG